MPSGAVLCCKPNALCRCPLLQSQRKRSALLWLKHRPISSSFGCWHLGTRLHLSSICAPQQSICAPQQHMRTSAEHMRTSAEHMRTSAAYAHLSRAYAHLSSICAPQQSICACLFCRTHADDNNPGTFPLQSERFYAVSAVLGVEQCALVAG